METKSRIVKRVLPQWWLRKTLTLTGACTLLWFAAANPCGLGAAQLDPTQFAAPLVWTDKQDYAPGGMALITGVGFATNETVMVQVLHADGTPGHGTDHEPWVVSADENGGFRTSWHVCEDDCLNEQLLLTGTGQESGAMAHFLFTDASGGSQVELQPGTIQGTIQLAGATVQSGYVYAYSQDGFSSSANFSGSSYALTVAGDKSWRVAADCRLQASSDEVYLNVTKSGYVLVPAGATITSDFNYTLGPIRGTITVAGGTLKSYYVYANASDANASFQGRYYGYMGSSSFTLPMALNNSVSVYGTATIQLASGTTVSLPLSQKSVSVPSGGGDVSWSFDVSSYDTTLGSVSGEVRLTGPATVTQNYIYLSANNAFQYQYLPGNGAYSFSGIPSGPAYPWVNSYFSSPYFFLRIPDPAALSNGQIDIVGGQDKQVDFINDLAFVRGKLTLSGFYDFSKVSQASVYAYGLYGTATVGGYGYDLVDRTTGAFDLALTPGPWSVYSWTANFYDYSNPLQPINVYYNSSDYTRYPSYGGQAVSLTAGSDVSVPDFVGTTASSQVIFDVAEASGQPQQLISSAVVYGYSNEYDSSGRPKAFRYFSAYGPYSSLATPAVQIVAEPGTYDVTAQAYVNGSYVVFSKFQLTLAVPQLTQTGQNITVQPSEDVPVSLTFDNVTVQGVTTVTEVPIGPKDAPPGFKIGIPGQADVFYDISTTAQFSGGVEVCIQYNDAGLNTQKESHLRLFHYNSATGKYEDITTSVDVDNNAICGVTTSFSIFTLGYSTDPEIISLNLPGSIVLAGTPVNVSAGFTDGDPNDSHTAIWNWGDGSISPGTVDEANGTVSGQHTYTDSGEFQVQLTLTDAAQNSVTATGNINVNQLPIARCRDVTTSAGTDCAATADVDNGSSDPDGDSINLTQSPPGPYPVGTTRVTLTVTDSKGGMSQCIATVTVVNEPPTLDVGGPYQVSEGGAVVLTASAIDPEDGALTFEWDLDNNGTFETPGATVTFSAALLDGPTSRLVHVRVIDACGAATVTQTSVEVLNVAPVFSTVTGPTGPVAIGTTVTISVPYSDAGILDTHLLTVSWDDASPDTTVAVSSGNSAVAHTYSAAGVYPLALTLRDDDNAVATTRYEYVVVYDPSAGFVTGGGWINSPAGAFVADPTLIGKANFGFVSKYQKGKTVPTGETEFQFHAANFTFNSTAYEWLVVSGALAQYKGVGTINGTGSYGFLLTTTDGQVTGGGGVDKFRIKIWDKATGAVVYDNVMGASDDINSASPQAIGGGSIVIQKAK